MHRKASGFLFCLIFFFLFYNGFVFSQESNPDLDSIISRGVDFIRWDKFDQGIAEFKKVIDLYPDEPIGYFFVGASLQGLIDDYRNETYNDEFEKYINLAIKKGNAKVDQNPNSALEHFYLGGALGYRGIYRSFRGNWWGAFMDGGKAYSHLKEAVEHDSTLYDAYFGLGSYHYWKSVKSKLFWWLPFFGDQREKGIQETMIAIQKGKYAKNEAANSLLRIYLEEKDYPAVIKWGEEVKKINPDNPFRLWMMSAAYIEMKNWDDAQNTLQYLLNVFKSSPYYDPAAEYECRYWLAFIHFRQGDFKSAQDDSNIALQLEPKVKGNDYAEPFLDKVKDLQKDISQKSKTK
ncbi:MAG TPA: tetratricopeptide repeat protein [Terriglobales bacterium]|nr:tetratricopeptide repeat protein [Terriglobales bacterium]